MSIRRGEVAASAGYASVMTPRIVCIPANAPRWQRDSMRRFGPGRIVHRRRAVAATPIRGARRRSPRSADRADLVSQRQSRRISLHLAGGAGFRCGDEPRAPLRPKRLADAQSPRIAAACLQSRMPALPEQHPFTAYSMAGTGPRRRPPSIRRTPGMWRSMAKTPGRRCPEPAPPVSPTCARLELSAGRGDGNSSDDRACARSAQSP